MSTTERNRQLAPELKNFEIEYDTETSDRPQRQPVPQIVQKAPEARVEVADEVLRRMDREPRHMDSRSLLAYFLQRFKVQFGFEYRCSNGKAKETAIMSSFIARYTAEDAYGMVALTFDKYKGILVDEPVNITHFSTGMKWVQDRLYHDFKSRGADAEYVPIPDAVETFKKLGLPI